MSDQLKTGLLSLLRVFDDQRNFNRNFFPAPESFEERSRQTKEYVLYLHSELTELLNKVNFKCHRDKQVLENRAAVLEELTDILKYLLSLYIVWDANAEELLAHYWRKSMICRQRYSEEFIRTLDRPCVIVDIDNVLCDYVRGLLRWIAFNEESLVGKANVLLQKVDAGEWVYLDSLTLQMQEQRWQELKHAFRVSGAKTSLPPMPGASEFTHWLRTLGVNIILLTSRPIDKYPNIYGDTLEWLKATDLQYDFIWWARDKRERVLSAGIQDLVKFVVDDDMEFVRQLSMLQTTVYFRCGLTRGMYDKPDNVVLVPSLADIRAHWEASNGGR